MSWIAIKNEAMTNAGNPAISSPGDCVYTVCRAWRETGKSLVKENGWKERWNFRVCALV